MRQNETKKTADETSPDTLGSDPGNGRAWVIGGAMMGGALLGLFLGGDVGMVIGATIGILAGLKAT